jgi:hypothetical protein
MPVELLPQRFSANSPADVLTHDQVIFSETWPDRRRPTGPWLGGAALAPIRSARRSGRLGRCLSSRCRDRDRGHGRDRNRLSRQLGGDERDSNSCSAGCGAELRLASLYARGPSPPHGCRHNLRRITRQVARLVTRSSADQTSGMHARFGPFAEGTDGVFIASRRRVAHVDLRCCPSRPSPHGLAVQRRTLDSSSAHRHATCTDRRLARLPLATGQHAAIRA